MWTNISPLHCYFRSLTQLKKQDESPSIDIVLYQRIKITKVVITSLLALSALSAFIASIVCAVLYTAPIFLTLMLVAVASSLLAYIAHKQLSRIANDNWTTLLTSYFNRMPAVTAANLFETFGNHFSFWQHFHNPNFYLALPRYADEFTYSLLSPVLYRAALSDTRYPKFLVNPIHPNVNYVSPNSNPSSQAIYTLLTNETIHQQDATDQNLKDVSLCSFAPTETHVSTTNVSQNLTQLEVKRCPNFLIHTRGPMLKEFDGPKQEIINQYFLRALISYKKILQKSIGSQSLHTVSVPIFSFIYENDDDFTHIDHLTAKKLCLSALVQAMNDMAHIQPGKLLVCVQLISKSV